MWRRSPRRKLATLRITNPCAQRWQDMVGDEQQRFCGQCAKHVHNLSALTAGEAQALIEHTPDLCVSFFPRPDGSPETRDTITMRVPSPIAVSAAALLVSSGCVQESQEVRVAPATMVQDAPFPKPSTRLSPVVVTQLPTVPPIPSEVQIFTERQMIAGGMNEAPSRIEFNGTLERWLRGSTRVFQRCCAKLPGLPRRLWLSAEWTHGGARSVAIQNAREDDGPFQRCVALVMKTFGFRKGLELPPEPQNILVECPPSDGA